MEAHVIFEIVFGACFTALGTAAVTFLSDLAKAVRDLNVKVERVLTQMDFHEKRITALEEVECPCPQKSGH